MASRKSSPSADNAAEVPETNDNDQMKDAAEPVDSGVNVEDYLLPRALTQRLAKAVLPPGTAIHKDALLAITKAATVFVSYLSTHANEETDKKTVTPQDVLSALKEVEFDSFRPRLERELALFTEAAARKQQEKSDKKQGNKEKSNANEEDEGPSIKRQKRDSQQHSSAENQDKSGNTAGKGTSKDHPTGDAGQDSLDDDDEDGDLEDDDVEESEVETDEGATELEEGEEDGGIKTDMGDVSEGEENHQNSDSDQESDED